MTCHVLSRTQVITGAVMVRGRALCPQVSRFSLQPPKIDDDPYVRKAAAICVAKVYDINAELVEDRGFLDALKDLISDNNPMVVANAMAALAEIQENSSTPVFEITSHTLSKLLTALNECTEIVEEIVVVF